MGVTHMPDRSSESRVDRRSIVVVILEGVRCYSKDLTKVGSDHRVRHILK